MKKVVVGISGGVDSSVAALLLKEQEYEVIGVTFVFTDDFDVNDAKSVCDKLNISHIVKDYRKEFKEKIIDNFILDYKNGLTPNPCVLCNKIVKIKYLFDTMEELNADFIATGHYAKINEGKLYKSENLAKDQTYFLAQLSSLQLKKILFPLEGFAKEKVREIAMSNGLINANKKDSFDVCFIKSSFKDYISSVVPIKEGPVINIDTNKEIGKHKGLEKYTIGQRRGLDIGGNNDRMFVVGKDITKNVLYVSLGAKNDYLLSDSCILKEVNFNIEERPIKCYARFRYKSQEYPVELEYLNDGSILVKYENISSVTPGQTCVFYDGNQCLGGGTIKEVRKDNSKLWYLG